MSFYFPLFWKFNPNTYLYNNRVDIEFLWRQVYCDVVQDNAILPLTKLRRHDVNYKVR
jgi:hypothetical protein